MSSCQNSKVIGLCDGAGLGGRPTPSTLCFLHFRNSRERSVQAAKTTETKCVTHMGGEVLAVYTFSDGCQK